MVTIKLVPECFMPDEAFIVAVDIQNPAVYDAMKTLATAILMEDPDKMEIKICAIDFDNDRSEIWKFESNFTVLGLRVK